MALNCFRFLDFKSFAQVDALTIPEYRLLMKSVELKNIDIDYRIHQQAFANFRVKARKKAGKNKTKPVYNDFKKFFDYEKELNKAVGKTKGKFNDLSKFIKERGEGNG